MKAVLILSLVAMTIAAPQGYNYQNEQSSSASVTATQEPVLVPAPIISKHFYLHSGPDDEAEAQDVKTLSVPARKHYRVLFIKSPASNNAAKLLKAAAPQTEEKTVIYVLKQKTDVAELKQALETTAKPPSKPEVFFIKYRTPEEALHAQHEIQAQYDVLGGTSQVSDEGVAPVTSVIGSVDKQAEARDQYLPPSE